jgi:hypothetical protein
MLLYFVALEGIELELTLKSTLDFKTLPDLSHDCTVKWWLPLDSERVVLTVDEETE